VPANRKSALVERALNKPYYVLRPGQALRRMRRAGRATPEGLATAPVPWNGELEVYPADEMGSDIWRTGVFELAVSETIARLLDPGELAIDAGANIGYMTTLMASRVGSGGRVIAYEPHPDLHRVLRSNAERASYGCDLSLVQAALSDRTGEGHLVPGPEFDSNMGTASLAPPGQAPPAESLRVPLERLDDRLADSDRAGLVKIDVEGHELSVLRGARRGLARRRIRDVVFEEHRPLPTPVTRLLESAGYVIFGLDQRLLGPRLIPPGALRARPLWVAPSFLATLDVGRARSRMRPRGWTVLRARPRESCPPTDVGSTS
jgi:FkbM family methyltransferase